VIATRRYVGVPARGPTNMPEPSFLSFGDEPQRQDTDWTAAVRWLGRVQNSVASPDPANNPKRTDSFWRVLYKIARALDTPTPPCTGATFVSDGSTGSNAMAVNGSQAVVVGEVGEILTSNDGTTWTPQVSGTVNDLWAVAYGNGLWVATGTQGGGGGTICYSSDTVNWTVTNVLGSQIFYGVAFGENLFVAVNELRAIYSSPDGANWTLRASYLGFQMMGVAYGNGMFVAVGSGGMVSTSEDGINWTQQVSGVASDLYDVAYGNGVFVAVSGTTLDIIYSSDGVNWSLAPIASAEASLWSVAFGNGLFVTNTFNSGENWTSADGAVWTKQLPNSGPYYMLNYYDDCNFVVNA